MFPWQSALTVAGDHELLVIQFDWCGKESSQSGVCNLLPHLHIIIFQGGNRLLLRTNASGQDISSVSQRKTGIGAMMNDVIYSSLG